MFVAFQFGYPDSMQEDMSLSMSVSNTSSAPWFLTGVFFALTFPRSIYSSRGCNYQYCFSFSPFTTFPGMHVAEMLAMNSSRLSYHWQVSSISENLTCSYCNVLKYLNKEAVVTLPKCKADCHVIFGLLILVLLPHFLGGMLVKCQSKTIKVFS